MPGGIAVGGYAYRLFMYFACSSFKKPIFFGFLSTVNSWSRVSKTIWNFPSTSALRFSISLRSFALSNINCLIFVKARMIWMLTQFISHPSWRDENLKCSTVTARACYIVQTWSMPVAYELKNIGVASWLMIISGRNMTVLIKSLGSAALVIISKSLTQAPIEMRNWWA